MRWLLAVMVVLVCATPAQALKPCHDACHLEQGTPLLLPDSREIWVRQCTKKKCVFERRDLDGNVKETIRDFDEYAFDDSLDGHRVVRLENQETWELAKPFVVPVEGRPLTLALGSSGSKRSLVCQREKERTELAVPCAKGTFVVRWGGIGVDSKPEDPSGIAAVVVTCGKNETTVVCK